MGQHRGRAATVVAAHRGNLRRASPAGRTLSTPAMGIRHWLPGESQQYQVVLLDQDGVTVLLQTGIRRQSPLVISCVALESVPHHAEEG